MKIGIDLGGSHIAIGVIDDKCYIVEKFEKRLLAKDKKNIKDSIESYIIKNINELTQKYKIKEIGIAVPGTIKGTTILKSVNLGVSNYDIVENLKTSICYMKDYPEVRRQMSEKAKLESMKYDEANYYKKFVEMINKIIVEKKAMKKEG